MRNTFLIDGHAAVTTDNDNQVFCFQFLPDNQDCQVVDSCQATGTAQLMRNGAFDFVRSPKRQRANSTLICKAAHGRLSGTRDKAFQLTLKSFATEAIDWQRAFVTETVDIMTDLMGPERMRRILKEIMSKL